MCSVGVRFRDIHQRFRFCQKNDLPTFAPKNEYPSYGRVSREQQSFFTLSTFYFQLLPHPELLRVGIRLMFTRSFLDGGILALVATHILEHPSLLPCHDKTTWSRAVHFVKMGHR
jgi:hypothetical protein